MRKRRRKCEDTFKAIYLYLVLAAVSTYIMLGVVAGSPGNGDLKKKLHCCAPQHIVFGAFGWYFPPIFIFLLLYQVADHYGFWWKEPLYQFHEAQETWLETGSDVIEYVVGFFIVELFRWMRPIRLSCLKKWWTHFRRSGRCIDAPPFFVHSCCEHCVDKYDVLDEIEEHELLEIT